MSSIRQDVEPSGEDVTEPRLVDHLLVELADPRLALADEEDAEQAAVGDRPAAGDGQPLGARARGELAGDAVPDDARPQLGERVARVAAGEHVEDGVVRALREGGEGCGTAYQGQQVVDLPGVHRDHRDDLLGEDVERVARDAAAPRWRRRACSRRRPRSARGRRGTWGR